MNSRATTKLLLTVVAMLATIVFARAGCTHRSGGISCCAASVTKRNSRGYKTTLCRQCDSGTLMRWDFCFTPLCSLLPLLARPSDSLPL